MTPLELVPLPTKLHQVEVEGVPLWVLDEGHPAAPYGGNKVRKLRFTLAQALGSGATDLVTFGAIGSHHVLATSIYGRMVGLRVHAVLIPQPHTGHVERQARRNHQALSSWVACESVAEVPAGTARLMAQVTARTGHVPARLGPGGSSVLGTVGWVELATELRAQLGSMPVVVASGSGGTAAGLWGGGLNVVAVRVGPRLMTNRRRLRNLGKRAARHVSGARPGDELVLEHGFVGGGYGHVDARTQRSMEVGLAQGWPMESTYTAKALGAALALAESGPVCFVQTASARSPPVPGGTLPEALRKLMH